MTTALREMLTAISLHGFHDSEAGNATEAPHMWAALFRFTDEDRANGLEHPDEGTRLAIDGLQGAILTCNSDGFYFGEAFDSRDMLELSWERLEADLTIDDAEGV